jgi:ATP-dependent DNA helicase RecQ
VPGFGERKTESYGPQILEALKEFVKGARARQAPKKNSRPAEETRRLLAQGHSLEEVANLRGRQVASVVALVVEMLEARELEFEASWITDEKLKQIEAACGKLGLERLRPLKDALPPEITFDEIRLVTAKLRQAKG